MTAPITLIPVKPRGHRPRLQSARDSKCQEYIAGQAIPLCRTGINKEHTSSDDRSSNIEGSAMPWNAIDCLEFTIRVVVPKYFPVRCRVCAEVAIQRA